MVYDSAAGTRQREQTKRTLLREGRRLFASRGFAAVGLTEITQAAGVAKGATVTPGTSSANVAPAAGDLRTLEAPPSGPAGPDQGLPQPREPVAAFPALCRYPG
ncbi:TetR/AcrR family transcriptional regulator [Yinghuangia sp. YIM S09857]|uniref:TetR/AcrR family transcriptional regulator n=1 Tax=Yinghuangia sp. YIM S09857 TaxID=3436929 RepID=UPI003F53DB4A